MAVRRPSWLVQVTERAGHVVDRVVRSATGADDFTLAGLAPYGCGLYGCAFPVQGTPWVVKVTTDEQEGRTWSWIEREGARLARERRLVVAAGLPRVADCKEVTRAMPRVRLRGERRRLFVVVREDLDPYECDESQRGRRTRTVADGSRPLHVGRPSAHTRTLAGPGGPLTRSETQRIDDALDEYRRAGWRLGDLLARDDDGSELAEALRSRMRRAARDMAATATARSMGLALREAAQDGCYLLDLHFGNVGWRRRSEILGWPTLRKDVLVVLDPGQTTLPRGLRRSVTHVPNPPPPDDLEPWMGAEEVVDEGEGW